MFYVLQKWCDEPAEMKAVCADDLLLQEKLRLKFGPQGDALTNSFYLPFSLFIFSLREAPRQYSFFLGRPDFLPLAYERSTSTIYMDGFSHSRSVILHLALSQLEC